MREYIHFFENSDLRDTYEHGSDYTEPYVSYTPVINEYKAQFNGNNIPGFNITKQKNSYLIQSNNGNLIIMNPEPPIVNSNVFYAIYGNKPATKAVADPRVRMFILEENLQLTEESTELTLNGVTYYLILKDTNSWSMYTDSEHTQSNGILRKHDIVSVPSSTRTDFVHYNKIPLPKSIYAKIKVEYDESNDQPAVMRRKISSRNDIFEKIIVDGNEILFNNEEPIRGQDNSVYYTFSSEGTHKIEYVLKDEYAGIMPRGMIPSYSATFDEITLPKGIYKIESDAFNNLWSRINKLNIPNTVTEVENCAIRCTNISSEVEDFLTSINPSSVCNNCK